MKLLNFEQFYINSKNRNKKEKFIILVQRNRDDPLIITGNTLIRVINSLFKLDIYFCRDIISDPEYPQLAFETLSNLIEDFEGYIEYEDKKDIVITNLRHTVDYKCSLYTNKYMKIILNCLKIKYISHFLRKMNKYNFDTDYMKFLTTLSHQYKQKIIYSKDFGTTKPINKYLIEMNLEDYFKKHDQKIILSIPLSFTNLKKYCQCIKFFIFNSKEEYYKNLEELFLSKSVKNLTYLSVFNPLDPWSLDHYELSCHNNTICIFEPTLDLYKLLKQKNNVLSNL